MLAVYNSHYFVVHYLLGIEQVVEGVMGAMDLYKVLQFGVSCLSSQIFFLLVEVFQQKIEDIQIKYGQTIWDMKFNVADYEQKHKHHGGGDMMNGQDFSRDDMTSMID